MQDAWIRIFGSVQTSLTNIVTILTSIGSKPAGDLLTIETSNSLLDDELSAYGKLTTFNIPTEFHTVYEARRLEINTSYSSTQYAPLSHKPLLFDYQGNVGCIFYSRTTSYLYSYATNLSQVIQVPIALPMYVEFGSNLNIYGYSGTTNTALKYYKVSYSSDFATYTTTELANPYFGFNAEDGTDLSLTKYTKLGALAFSPYYADYVPQKIDSGYFCGIRDKAIYLNDNLIPTRQMQFDDSNLLGSSPTSWLDKNWSPGYQSDVPSSYLLLTDVYSAYGDGRIYRYKVD